MKFLGISGTVVGSILATGVFLNLAGSGALGTQMQKFAKYVTQGYGV